MTPEELRAREAAVLADPLEDGARLLDEVAGFVRRYLVMDDDQLAAAVLWTSHAHAVDAAQDTPRLHISSPEPESGKSRLLEVLASLAPRARLWVGPSEAVLYRTVEAEHPTLFLDEIDTVFSEKGAKEHEGVRAFLNTGYHRGATVPRCMVEGKGVRVVEFGTFAPVALAGIGELPRTIATRSIPIRLSRSPKGALMAKYRRPLAAAEGAKLRERLAAVFCEDVVAELEGADATMPDGLSDRHEDVWAPLLAIADHVGGRWPERARIAAVALCGKGAEHQPEDSTGVALLTDCREVFERLEVDRISSKILAAELAAIDEAPWGDWYRRRAAGERGLDDRGLARQLKPYGIVSKSIRLTDGTTPKGYSRDLFEPAWRSYCPPAGNGGFVRHTATTRMATAIPNDSRPPQGGSCGGRENGENPHGKGDVAVLRTKPPLTGAGGILTPADHAAADAYAKRFRQNHEPIRARRSPRLVSAPTCRWGRRPLVSASPILSPLRGSRHVTWPVGSQRPCARLHPPRHPAARRSASSAARVAHRRPPLAGPMQGG